MIPIALISHADHIHGDLVTLEFDPVPKLRRLPLQSTRPVKAAFSAITFGGRYCWLAKACNMNRGLTGVCKTVLRQQGRSLGCAKDTKKLHPLLDSWLSRAKHSCGNLPSFWCPDVILLTFEFFIEVALTEIALYPGMR
jgi:hypothetical protein